MGLAVPRGRPGLLDLACAIGCAGYGVITYVHPEGWQGKRVYDFLDGADLAVMSGVFMALGLVQGVAFVWGADRLGRWCAGLGTLVWGAFWWGGFQHDSDAYVPWMYANAAIGNSLALWRGVEWQTFRR